MTAGVSTTNSTIVRSNFALRSAGFALRTVDFLAPRIASRFAADLFLTPRRRPRPGRENDWISGARRESERIAGLPLVLWRWSAAERPVLLLHGWEGRGSQMGSFALALEKQGIASIAPDFPAHGDSPGRRSNILEFAGVVRELIDRHHPSAIIAHSFGSPATMLAIRETRFDGRLVFIAPPEDFAFFTATFAAMLEISQDLGHRMQREIEERFSIDWSRMRGRDLAREMSSPLLVVHDADDQDVPLEYGEAIASSWPGAELQVTTGLGHHRILREPAVVDQALSFITR